MPTLQNALSRVRGLRGLQQQALAALVGISRQSLGSLEAGRSAPSTTIALRLAEVLRCPVEELFWLGGRGRALRAELAGPRAEGTAQATRVAVVSVGGRWIAHPLAGRPGALMTAADGLVRGAGQRTTGVRVELLDTEQSLQNTLLVAGCAPALGLLAARFSQQGRERLRWHESPSVTALELLGKGHAHLAGVHLLDEPTGEFNVPLVRSLFRSTPMLVFNLARWEAGLVVAAGNPLSIRSAKDLVRRDVRLVRRPAAAAAEQFLERLLRDAGARKGAGRAVLVARGHEEVAQAVAMGAADVGISIRSVALSFGLGFVPMAEERFDLVVTRDLAAEPRVQRLIDTLGSPAFRRDLAGAGGYDTRRSGQLVADLGVA